MENGDYFVMLHHQKAGLYLPLMQNDYDIAQFETEEQARLAAGNSMLGEVFGYEVFNINDGR